ncbi:MAG TPA: divalent cation tolerance protein CutA [Candidatus Saccharimonadales bacterium]|nr:divalent cation tolerance protein CutA [Candidatus Saccharimonadales bacterium]
MTKAKLTEVLLTCGSWQEAQNIVDDLFAKKLIACAEFLEVKSKFAWQGELNQAKEVKLIMLTTKPKFTSIEKVVRAHHSYDTFVLQALPVDQISKKAQLWLDEVIE